MYVMMCKPFVQSCFGCARAPVAGALGSFMLSDTCLIILSMQGGSHARKVGV